jgi:hypothetical protein
MATYRLIGGPATSADTNYNIVFTGTTGTTTYGKMQISNRHTAEANVRAYVTANAFAGGASAPTTDIQAVLVLDAPVPAGGVIVLNFSMSGTAKLVARSDNAAGLGVVVQATEQTA